MSDEDVDRMGRTRLHYAAAEGTVEEVERCLAGGSDVAAADRQGYTALHFACQQSRDDVVAVLLAAGAPVEVVDAWGNTPLWRAVFSAQGSPVIVRRLVAVGADPDRENLSGVSPRALAERMGMSDPSDYFDPKGG
ncbi:ankyrin repeat domain-containing protein [Kineosporia sp. A_224]|uniref:ankyrin repeat domain-containing protein n=1 Tax=Kineosporia sp. A_224 TaxID=1962180 RepID=UPI000B4AF33A|nr:ankyrin repeat domain-containing protein [Kineosporia sp. A_224]